MKEYRKLEKSLTNLLNRRAGFSLSQQMNY